MPREVEIPDEWIGELERDYGLTEDEAYVFSFLLEARRLYNELPDAGFNNEAFRTSIRTAHNVLAWRVARRDHPNGWLTHEEREERGKD